MDKDSDIDKSEERRIRVLSDEDINYFENEFFMVVIELVHSLT